MDFYMEEKDIDKRQKHDEEAEKTAHLFKNFYKPNDVKKSRRPISSGVWWLFTIVAIAVGTYFNLDIVVLIGVVTTWIMFVVSAILLIMAIIFKMLDDSIILSHTFPSISWVNLGILYWAGLPNLTTFALIMAIVGTLIHLHEKHEIDAINAKIYDLHS